MREQMLQDVLITRLCVASGSCLCELSSPSLLGVDSGGSTDGQGVCGVDLRKPSEDPTAKALNHNLKT